MPVFPSSSAFARFLLPVLTSLSLLASLGEIQAQDADPYLPARLKMVKEQIMREGIRNERVLTSMRTTPRHMFVAENLRSRAYNDEILPIGYKQTLSTGYIVAYMTDISDPQPDDKVLEIGTGSGYQAAVLSPLVKEVYTIEIVDPLAKEATERLKKLGYKNVFTRSGDGYKGWPEAAPFDKILVTCSPEKVPQPLIDQLKEGGKMIIPLGERYSQAFYLFEKQQGKLVQTRLLPTLFVPMTGAADKQRDKKVDGAHPKLVNGSFEQITEGVPEGWFYQRQLTVETFGAREGNNFVTFINSDPKREAHAIQAIGIDGRKVSSVRFTGWVRYENTVPGAESYERPALVLHFYDSENKQIDELFIGPWLGTSGWKRFGKEFKVPANTQVGMLRIGLNGATGKISFDDIKLTSRGK